MDLSNNIQNNSNTELIENPITYETPVIIRSNRKEAMNSNRFNDPYLEIIYSARQKSSPNSVSPDNVEYNDKSNSSAVSNDEIITELKPSDRFYSKIYRHPILDKRTKINDRIKDELDSEFSNINIIKNEPKESNYKESNLKQPLEINSNSNNIVREKPRVHFEFDPDYESKPMLMKPSEVPYMSSLKSSIHNDTYPTNNMHHTFQSKFRPLCGNLKDIVQIGKYNCREDSYSKTLQHKNSSDKSKPAIFPYKN